jgi:tetratricopeptide (TPR) repeat protein
MGVARRTVATLTAVEEETMRTWLLLSLCALLAACAGPRELTRPPEQLFDDGLFAAPSERIGTGDIFAVSDAMRRYLQHPQIEAQLRRKGPQRGLLEALYTTGELRLDYEGVTTRNAAQAFEARAGNCLSLVVMTAAFAKELGLQVRYQSAYLEETISRSGNLVLRSGHVNVTLDRRFADPRFPNHEAMTVDFLPPEELKGLRTREIAEETVVAMYLNNRAVEALVAGRLDDAYAWARESARQDPDFLGSLNTLGVIYLRRDALAHAARVFGHVLERDSDNLTALANLANAYARQGRTEEALSVQRRLAALEPEPPYHYLHLGLAALKKQDFGTAERMFAREVARSDDDAEAHYWLGIASYRLGNVEQARRHMERALEASTSGRERGLYAAKLDWIEARSHGR